jgi:hypothetical protein
MKKNHEVAKLESALEAIIPLLQAASQASHKIKEAEAKDDPEQGEFDRLMDLGMLTDCVGNLCGPNLAVLVRVMFALMGSEHEEEAEPQQLHHH